MSVGEKIPILATKRNLTKRFNPLPNFRYSVYILLFGDNKVEISRNREKPNCQKICQ